jgi:hypothetical protein
MWRPVGSYKSRDASEERTNSILSQKVSKATNEQAAGLIHIVRNAPDKERIIRGSTNHSQIYFSQYIHIIRRRQKSNRDAPASKIRMCFDVSAPVDAG